MCDVSQSKWENVHDKKENKKKNNMSSTTNIPDGNCIILKCCIVAVL